jgi:ADP-heptose:LPS heptosyltransferase
LTSTSCEELARAVLADCIAGRAPAELPCELTDPRCAGALFGILAEGLGDRFEPALCDVYARLFAQAIPGADAERYFRVRHVRPVACEPRRVFVLSRITLGADIAITSVLMDAAKRRFPKARIAFVGPRKNFELFAGDPQLTHVSLDYRRDSYQETWRVLREMVDDLVIDPDSRLTQLGLLPIGDEDRYHLFESRGYGGDCDLSLSELAAKWAEETMGITDARPYLAIPATLSPGDPYIAVSLGVGQNHFKRIADPFEQDLLKVLAAIRPIIIDHGGGGEESDRVGKAVQAADADIMIWGGSFAGFAESISAASLYVGYDSAGQHAAAASGVPQICVFAGFPTLRMFHRWRPVAPNAKVIRVDNPNPAVVLEQVRRLLG